MSNQLTELEKRVIEALQDKSPLKELEIKKAIRIASYNELRTAIVSLQDKRIVGNGETQFDFLLTDLFKTGQNDGDKKTPPQSRDRGYLWGYYLHSQPVFLPSGALISPVAE